MCEWPLSPLGLSPVPLDAIIDFAMASFNGQFARAKFNRTLYRAIARINVPAPKRRLNLLDVVMNCSM
jgi:hypothetical protein